MPVEKSIEGCVCVRGTWRGNNTPNSDSTSEGDKLHYLQFYVPNHNQSLAIHRQLTAGVQSPLKHKHTHKFKHSVFRYSNFLRHICKKKKKEKKTKKHGKHTTVCLCMSLCARVNVQPSWVHKAPTKNQTQTRLSKFTYSQKNI